MGYPGLGFKLQEQGPNQPPNNGIVEGKHLTTSWKQLFLPPDLSPSIRILMPSLNTCLKL
ncbi:hypothetical protein HanPI659440_Chr12g0446991 [Helianthus annuus]|nr:hypothetical protein HanPI659440_Chr12g0446991 [Helianthus annuus]